MALTAECAWLIALIKPQFEAEPAQVGKGGVVRDARVREAVCRRISAWLAAQAFWQVMGITESPITGPQGNIEFLIAARRAPVLAKDGTGA
jgi:23S rRNA (cytidine1920-2'-O)/16S rRNA (cytidine1409-2'-O)-methyltransferase